ncbi:MAG TPA: lasso peptide isopeptide bond-forming cyclase [Egibacteraceae bacterium]|nr:lasso peptide isopeptide bond-forming cyclase [Egibacteraceae bacterium]
MATALRPQAAQVVNHPSGRPWLLGRWDPETLVVGEAGRVKIALVGQHAVAAEQLGATAGRVTSVAGLDRVASSLAGSFHLLASVDGRVRVQGSVTGLRPVFHARVEGTTVAADRADVLARLIDAPFDERRLAANLLDSSAIYPLAGQPVWRGVSVLMGADYLLLDGEGSGRPVRWWSPPEPALPLAEGAAALREALWAAVDARLTGRDLVSADLGGLDSTALCCLAARRGGPIVAYTADGGDPLGQDVSWARRTVAALGAVEHHVIAGDALPMVYDGLLHTDDVLDEPSAAAVCLTRWLAIARPTAQRGSRLHLTGFGGDELLAGSPAHLHGLFRSHPRIALRNARGFAVQRRWSYREALRQLADRRDYRTWLRDVADNLTAPAPAIDIPSMDWGRPARMPPWATPGAVEAVRELIREAAQNVEPLSDRRGQHVELEAMRATSRMVRQLAQVADRLGFSLAAPYYDDRVVEAGLAVRPQDRVTPWRYKPLIIEAMRGIVPAESLTRQTKDEGSHEVEAGLREHRAGLLELWEDSRLARLGLVDAGALREVLSRPLGPSLQFDTPYQTVASEVWLRALEDKPLPARGDSNATEAA